MQCNVMKGAGPWGGAEGIGLPRFGEVLLGRCWDGVGMVLGWCWGGVGMSLRCRRLLQGVAACRRVSLGWACACEPPRTLGTAVHRGEGSQRGGGAARKLKLLVLLLLLILGRC